MFVSAAALSLAIWVYLLALRGGFWRSGPVLERRALAGRPKVTVVVPARDEAEHIAASVGSLLVQEYAGELRVVLVDDNSTDGTGEIARGRGGGGRLTVVRGAALPAGWSGKLWAVQQGLEQAEARFADYVLLTDADIVHGPGHVAALVAKAEADGLDLASEMVRLHCDTWAERALIPAFVFFFQMLYPFAWVNQPNRRTAGAAGGTILVRRAALERIGGVARIRERLIDDCALAGEVKRSGGRIWLGHAEDAVSLRVYGEWREVWNMIARTAYEQLGYSVWLLAGCVLGLALTYLVPPAAAVFANGWARWAGAVAWVMMAVAFQPTLRRYGRSPLWGVALPGIALFYLAATVGSAVRHWCGRGGGWKERVYGKASGQ